VSTVSRARAELAGRLGWKALGVQIAGEKRLYFPDFLAILPGTPREFTPHALSTHALLTVEITSKDIALSLDTRNFR
jgi:hypothetical protein